MEAHQFDVYVARFMFCNETQVSKDVNAAASSVPIHRRARVGYLLLSQLLVSACVATGAPSERPTTESAEAAGMVNLITVSPTVEIDLRYAGTDNFVGARIDGYETVKCYLHRQVAEALAQVQRDVSQEGLRLRVFDCYRPQRAVQHFIRWAQNLDEQKTKPQYYPEIDKRLLLGDYIAPVSGHSRGATLDLTLERCGATTGNCQPLDMGCNFDHFGPIANTDSTQITIEQHANRQRLRKAMQRRGFENYPLEWWHYTFKPEPTPQTYYDFPIR